MSATAATGSRDLRLLLVTGRYAETVALLRDGLGLPPAGATGRMRAATSFAAGPVVIEVVCGERPDGGRAALRLEGNGPAPSPPGLTVVACVDAGAEALGLLGLDPGEAHLITNAGGVVTSDVARDVAAARRSLGVRRVVVVQHEPCALLAPGPPPPAHALSPCERLRASLALLTRPPAGLAPDRVRGLLHRHDGTMAWIKPP